jgi:uncharacterized protein YndB with AHSA1/START domain
MSFASPRGQRGTNPEVAVSTDHIARADIAINATKADVWTALVTPSAIKQYMFGADVVSDWTEGSGIVWKGEWQGKRYEDKGVIRRLEPGRKLQYTHYSPLSGLPDTPENYHTVTIELTVTGLPTNVVLTQDNNPTEEARAHSEQNWRTMLAKLKEYVER